MFISLVRRLECIVAVVSHHQELKFQLSRKLDDGGDNDDGGDDDSGQVKDGEHSPP